ncbi:MAG: alpha-amylase family glycosyl hydrolase [Clostridium sp.]
MHTWYEQAVFYHIYPLGLLGAEKTNTLTETAHRFVALEDWIPHIHALNGSAIYIGPLFESSTHGYDTRDFRLVDRRLGSNEDFARFVRLCHESGIRVVVDGVFNHTGREFFAFRDICEKREASPYKDWYRGVNFGWGSPLGDPFGYEAWQGHFELPCLNLWNPEVRQYLFDSIRFWVDNFDIDGIRLDCANVLDFGFMKELREKTSSMKPDFWLMGEVIHGEYSRWVNPKMLHSVTNYELHKAFYSGHNDHNYFEIAHNVRRLEAVGRFLYTFVDNHDEDRIASKLNNPANLFPVYQLLFTLPGIPSVYYGSEWGIEGKRSRTSDEVLRPALSLSDMDEKAPELVSHIAALGKIHAENDAFHTGSYKELLLTNRQYAFSRSGEHGTVISAVNNDEQPASISIPLPCAASDAVSLLPGEIPFSLENGRLSVTLPANGGAIFKLQEV